jgi:L-lactate dehydrogenase complex protein LldF
MKPRANQFDQNAKQAIADHEIQAAVPTAVRTVSAKRLLAMYDTSDEYGEALRQQAADIKRYTLQNLPDLLEQAAAKMESSGMQVLWANDAAAARELVLEIAHKHNTRKATKSKSMVTEEIGLNAALEAAGITTIETDLGEYIIQLDGDVPSHIVTPVIHKSKDQIRQLFIDTIDMPPTDDVAEMARFAREKLRQEFLSSDMGISGGNFVIAETGTLGLVTNEGNARMVTHIPPVHVAVVGIEKIVPTLEDYALLTQVLPRSATGQQMAVYSHMITGPRGEDEIDGPEHIYVIFVDNGRSDIYASDYAEALACIRCGACLNICPVYRTVGGHSYGWVYPGPIGSIVTPLLLGLEQAVPLPHACSLCGACQEACPVKIDLPCLLLNLRRDLVVEGHGNLLWQAGVSIWSQGVGSPGLYGMGLRAAQFVTNQLPLKPMPGPLSGWTDYRDTPQFASQSFRKWWDEHRQEQDNEN